MATGAPETASPSGQADEATTYDISREAENKIIYKLSLVGLETCKGLVDDFNMCCKGRTFTQLRCKGLYDISQVCMHKFVNTDNIEIVRKRWVDGGKSRHPDWTVLLEGVEERAVKEHNTTA